MIRSVCRVLFLAMAAGAGTAVSNGQSGASVLEAYFTGREVILKIDMPGTQKGVDLRFNKPLPMDWKEYGSRVKQFGVAIHKVTPPGLRA